MDVEIDQGEVEFGGGGVEVSGDGRSGTGSEGAGDERATRGLVVSVHVR